MALGLKLPKIDKNNSSVSDKTSSAINTARFISEGDRRPSSGKAIPKNYRLKEVFIEIMEEEAQRTGMNQTDILKAALAAFSRGLDENQKNYWLLESKKL